MLQKSSTLHFGTMQSGYIEHHIDSRSKFFLIPSSGFIVVPQGIGPGVQSIHSRMVRWIVYIARVRCGTRFCHRHIAVAVWIITVVGVARCVVGLRDTRLGDVAR